MRQQSEKENSVIRRKRSVAALLVFWILTILPGFYSSVSSREPNGRVILTDVTASSGITFKHIFAPEKKYIIESMSGGVALFDFDRDGWLDIYFVNSPTVATASDPRSARSELWRNNGNGTFTDVTE